jgi:hypothetical protein
VSSGGGRVWSTLLASGFGGLGLKTIGGGFMSLGLKTRAEVPRRNGRHVAASGSSRRGEVTDEEARWPSDEDDTGLDHNVLGLSDLTQLYPGAKLRLCNSLLNTMREPPSPSPPPFFFHPLLGFPPSSCLCEREVH